MVRPSLNSTAYETTTLVVIPTYLVQGIIESLSRRFLYYSQKLFPVFFQLALADALDA